MDAGRALLLRAHDAERRLDAALQTPHRPTDPPIVALRAELRGHYRALLLDHFDLVAAEEEEEEPDEGCCGSGGEVLAEDDEDREEAEEEDGVAPSRQNLTPDIEPSHIDYTTELAESCQDPSTASL